MKQASNKEHLAGTVERVTYHNPENGFVVLRIKIKNHKDIGNSNR